MASVKLRDLRKSFGSAEIIRGVDLTIEDGEFVVFVGPSGCGKSTLLRLIAGLEPITKGELSIDNRVMNDVPASARGVAMVFQSYALYPHLTVRDNMGFGLKVRKVPRGEREKAVGDAAALLKLEALLDRFPRQLSGGQRQRVAIGRAIVANPSVFLFDEPLSNLDAELRVHMRSEIASLHQRVATTMVYVTHDQVEAMTLADKIVVLKDGMIEQVGTPRELYERPANIFVAQFIGSPKMNILSVDAASAIFQERAVPQPATQCGFRPEHFRIGPADHSGLQGTVLLAEYVGSETLLHIELDSHDVCLALHRGEESYPVRSRVSLSADQENIYFFDAEGKAVARS
ncbi:ABC transporter ATP-binding protein [Aureimonas fodinaquatilis]|uniref:ABC transporter ATP-binding protein n=1 Tax=Aureimonas fodinaquatilis TaxID=2565783 RepID=A0A5B0DW05_9HYPH|nr:ABC transporter ATP-binding protein [Aureimonas fodinaquatilis]KAA0969369.1 ABC transporter ATP-binding protein [Aureimonas fodinaquatilis]